MTPNEMRVAYERLAMLHTETMAELAEMQKRMDRMPREWWPLFKCWVLQKVGYQKWYE